MKKYHLSVRLEIEAENLEDAQKKGHAELVSTLAALESSGCSGWKNEEGIQQFLACGEIVLLDGGKLPKLFPVAGAEPAEVVADSK